MNATLQKFGYPATLLREYGHWAVLLRPAQATLGALILGSLHEARALSALPAPAFAELATVTADIERALTAFRTYERINYLCLMMVDPHVHFHVLPRYSKAQAFAGETYPDPGWPGVPDMKSAVTPSESGRQQLLAALMDLLRRPV